MLMGKNLNAGCQIGKKAPMIRIGVHILVVGE
jgi:hypothetical protein